MLLISLAMLSGKIKCTVSHLNSCAYLFLDSCWLSLFFLPTLWKGTTMSGRKCWDWNRAALLTEPGSGTAVGIPWEGCPCGHSRAVSLAPAEWETGRCAVLLKEEKVLMLGGWLNHELPVMARLLLPPCFIFFFWKQSNWGEVSSSTQNSPFRRLP